MQAAKIDELFAELRLAGRSFGSELDNKETCDVATSDGAESSSVLPSKTTSDAALLAAVHVPWQEERKARVNEEVSRSAAPKRRSAHKRTAEKTPSGPSKTEAMRLALRQEMEAAKETAMRERWKNGGYKGAIEARSFGLQNPGGGLDLIEDASMTLVRGRRYALVGRNGKGKSTLLQALTARRVGDLPASCSVHYASQDITLSDEEADMYPIDVVLAADVERRVLLADRAKYREAGNVAKAAETATKLEAVEDGAERRALELLEDLGFSEELRHRKLSRLSGGWRVRTFLAAALFSKPDLLLLDEPTNHLSIGAVLWLAHELTTNETWQDRIVVVVSHDRVFLEDVCTDVLHISGAARRLTQSHGSYSTWAKRRDEHKLAWARDKQRRENEIAKLEEYAGHGFRYGGSYSQIAKMKMKERQADKLRAETDAMREELAALQEDAELPINLASAGEADFVGNLVSLVKVSFCYNEESRFLFEGADLAVHATSRLVFVGENGNGKTTLIKLICGDLEPTLGEVKRSPHARIALVNQHHTDQIDLQKTPLDFMRHKFPGDGSYDHDLRLRSHLASCGVTGGNPDLQNVPALALSGGQRSRVALAAVSYIRPHVYVSHSATHTSLISPYSQPCAR